MRLFFKIFLWSWFGPIDKYIIYPTAMLLYKFVSIPILFPFFDFVYNYYKFFKDTFLFVMLGDEWRIPKLKFEEEQEKLQGKIFKENVSVPYEDTINILITRNRTKFYSPHSSFWPFLIAFSLSTALFFFATTFHCDKLFNMPKIFFVLIFASVMASICFWFYNFYTERVMGYHISIIKSNVKLAFYIFIITEALCFIGLFWVFFHSFLAPGIQTGIHNPGEGVANFYLNERIKFKYLWDIYMVNNLGDEHHIIRGSTKSNIKYYKEAFIDSGVFQNLNSKSMNFIELVLYDKGQLLNPYKLPLVNTFILLTSAAVLNASHVALKKSYYKESSFLLLGTICLGLFFVSMQYVEYKNATLSFNDGIYSVCLYSLTGLHGFHVIAGVTVLFICLINISRYNYTSKFHQSFYYAILYWHFVDIVWIIVYFVMYYWPGSYFFCEKIKIMDINTRFIAPQCTFQIAFSTDYFNGIIHEEFKKAEKMLSEGVKDEFLPDKVMYLKIFDENIRNLNFNLIKKDPQLFCFFMNITHDTLKKTIIDYNLLYETGWRGWIKNNICSFGYDEYRRRIWNYFLSIVFKVDRCKNVTCPFHDDDSAQGVFFRKSAKKFINFKKD